MLIDVKMISFIATILCLILFYSVPLTLFAQASSNQASHQSQSWLVLEINRVTRLTRDFRSSYCTSRS